MEKLARLEKYNGTKKGQAHMEERKLFFVEKDESKSI